MYRILYFCIFIGLITSCKTVNFVNKGEFEDGIYTQKSRDKKEPVFVDLVENTIRIYHVELIGKEYLLDTLSICHFYDEEIKGKVKEELVFSKYSWDLDFLTIPIKTRPSSGEIPPQINTYLNGSLYTGIRKDKFKISYDENILGISQRTISHRAFSFGAFMGFGNSFIGPSTTDNLLQQEYEGIIWSKGVAGIFGVNKFTLGLALGWDYLLDKNRHYWIYQSRPYLGLAFGLNLN